MPASPVNRSGYRGRIAPSPTGYLHLGHARTFWTAQQRARANGGILVLRNEDLDRDRCKPEFVSAMFEDLRWFGFEWQEGPDVGGLFAPYNQTERLNLYQDAFQKLRDMEMVYPCTCSRKDIHAAARAPHAADDNEPIYPGTCRRKYEVRSEKDEPASDSPDRSHFPLPTSHLRHSWRFHVRDGEKISFLDEHLGPQTFIAGKDFSDFVVWRHDGLPSYQLACAVDDAAMRITEVVRGADLLMSTARQLLLYRALGLTAPGFFHCDLMTDESGVRLAKRHEALSLRTLRRGGRSPEELRQRWK